MALLNDFMKPHLEEKYDAQMKALAQVSDDRVKQIDRYLLATYPFAERADRSRAGRFMLTQYSAVEWWACFLSKHDMPSAIPMPMASRAMIVKHPYQIVSHADDPYSYHWVTIPTRLVWVLRPGRFYVLELNMRGRKRAQICNDAFQWWEDDWKEPRPSDWQTRRTARVPQAFVRAGGLEPEDILELLRAYQEAHHTLMKRVLADSAEVLLGL